MAKGRADMTGVRSACADVPVLGRVLTASRGDTQAFAVPDGYLSGGYGERLRQRPQWRSGQPPGIMSTTALTARLASREPAA